MEGNAVIEQYSGGYDDYIAQVKDKKNIISNKDNNLKAKLEKPKQKLSYNDQQLLKSIPGDIENLENEIFVAQKSLSDPDFYQNPDAHNLNIKLYEMEKKLESLYEQWSKLDNG